MFLPERTPGDTCAPREKGRARGWGWGRGQGAHSFPRPGARAHVCPSASSLSRPRVRSFLRVWIRRHIIRKAFPGHPGAPRPSSPPPRTSAIVTIGVVCPHFVICAWLVERVSLSSALQTQCLQEALDRIIRKVIEWPDGNNKQYISLLNHWERSYLLCTRTCFGLSS